MRAGSESLGNGKGHPIGALFQSQKMSVLPPTIFELSCKLELHLKRALDHVHGAEFSDDAAIEQTLLHVTTNITEVIRDIRARLKQ
jgi:hypothetical protein